MKNYSYGFINQLLDRNARVSKIWSTAIVTGDFQRMERCKIISRKISKIVADLLCV